MLTGRLGMYKAKAATTPKTAADAPNKIELVNVFGNKTDSTSKIRPPNNPLIR